jgi:putative ABC transport system ATP-binding protein
MLKVEGLSKSYKTNAQDLCVLNNISFEVKEREFVAIMGRSGCGKTTLLNILGLIDDFDKGDYFFENKNMSKLSAKEQAKFRGKEIGFVFQSFYLLQELNCKDNISLAMGYTGVSKKERDKRANELLELVGLSEKAQSFPNKLSGGQQQRVAIARALSNSPGLILADEPTGNLDYKNGIEIMELLQQLNKDGTTIVMVTHDEEFSHFANRVLHMKDGVFV